MTAATIPCPHCAGTGKLPAPPTRPRCRSTRGEHRCCFYAGHRNLMHHCVEDGAGLWWENGDPGVDIAPDDGAVVRMEGGTP